MADDISSKVKKIVADHLGIEESKETEESSLILYSALFLVLGSVLFYGYRNFYVDDGYEDEYDDFDELEDVP